MNDEFVYSDLKEFVVQTFMFKERNTIYTTTITILIFSHQQIPMMFLASLHGVFAVTKVLLSRRLGHGLLTRYNERRGR